MRRCLLCTLLMLCLSGCQVLPFARELESTMLVQVLGVDWAQGTVTLTAAKDPQEDTGETGQAVLCAGGEDLLQAEAALKGMGEEYVSLTHVTQLVLGRDTQVREVLQAVLDEPDLGQGATVWIAREGTAQQLLQGADGGARRLSSIQLNSGLEPVTVLQALMHLEEDGQVALPQLALEGETLVPLEPILIREDDHGT